MWGNISALFDDLACHVGSSPFSHNTIPTSKPVHLRQSATSRLENRSKLVIGTDSTVEDCILLHQTFDSELATLYKAEKVQKVARSSQTINHVPLLTRSKFSKLVMASTADFANRLFICGPWWSCELV
jgi:hypothetical protein